MDNSTTISIQTISCTPKNTSIFNAHLHRCVKKVYTAIVKLELCTSDYHIKTSNLLHESDTFSHPFSKGKMSRHF